jgi:hypothetical protein
VLSLTSRTLTAQHAHERDQAARRIMTLDGEPRGDHSLGDARGREPQLAVHPLAKSPAIRLPYPDEIVHLHARVLVLEETRHDEIVPGSDWDHAIQVAQLAAEVAERQHQPAPEDEPARHALKDALEIRLALEMGKRVAHADGQRDALRREPRHVADVARDRLDRQAARTSCQLVEKLPTEVDRQYPIAKAREGDRLKPGAATEIDGERARRRRRDAQSLEQRALLRRLTSKSPNMRE